MRLWMVFIAWSVLLPAQAAAQNDGWGAWIGRVHLSRGAPGEHAVTLQRDNYRWRLVGPLAQELAHVPSARVEVLGQRQDDETHGRLWVKRYRLLDIDGRRPLVGTLRQKQARLMLVDGPGHPIPLNASPASRPRLNALLGARLWVVGHYLPSGEVRVLRYGVLAPPPSSPPEKGANVETRRLEEGRRQRMPDKAPERVLP